MHSLLSRLWIGALCAFTPLLSAEEIENVSTNETREEVIALRSEEELDHLVAKIALYPDVLVALILPSATTPTDIVLASRALKVTPGRTNWDAEPWSDSVKGLVHYREVVEMLDQNIGWTKDLGDAFLAQPADVMNAIQRMRSQARADGLLKDTAQQVVVVEEKVVKIYPRETSVIYVPRYDSDILFYRNRWDSSDAFLTFGLGFTAGAWLSYDCDWSYRRIWVVPPAYRRAYWSNHRSWHQPHYVHGRPSEWHHWRPEHRWHNPNPRGPSTITGQSPGRYRNENRSHSNAADLNHRPDRTDRPRRDEWHRSDGRDHVTNRPASQPPSSATVQNSQEQARNVLRRSRLSSAATATQNVQSGESRGGRHNHEMQRTVQPRAMTAAPLSGASVVAPRAPATAPATQPQTQRQPVRVEAPQPKVQSTTSSDSSSSSNRGGGGGGGHHFDGNRGGGGGGHRGR